MNEKLEKGLESINNAIACKVNYAAGVKNSELDTEGLMEVRRVVEIALYGKTLDDVDED